MTAMLADIDTLGIIAVLVCTIGALRAPHGSTIRKVYAGLLLVSLTWVTNSVLPPEALAIRTGVAMIGLAGVVIALRGARRTELN